MRASASSYQVPGRTNLASAIEIVLIVVMLVLAGVAFVHPWWQGIAGF